jgi:hypothetical protein
MRARYCDGLARVSADVLAEMMRNAGPLLRKHALARAKELLLARRELSFRRTQMGRWEDDGGRVD